MERFGRIDGMVNCTGHESKATSTTLRAWLVSYAKQYSTKHAPDGIRMSSILPGSFESLPEKPGRVARLSVGRYARVWDLLETAAHLASDALYYVMGGTSAWMAG